VGNFQFPQMGKFGFPLTDRDASYFLVRIA
jgi:hypothetical protein